MHLPVVVVGVELEMTPTTLNLTLLKFQLQLQLLLLPPPPPNYQTSSSKIGFMFLTTEDHSNPCRWKRFFNGVDPLQYKIVVHAKYPDRVQSPLFRPNTLSNPILTKRADFSLVQATLRLIKAMLADGNVTSMVLLSETCIPLLSFQATVKELEASPTRFSFHGPYFSKWGCPSAVASAVHANAISLGLRLGRTDCVKQQQFFSLSRSDAIVLISTAAAPKYLAMKNMKWPDEGFFANVLLAENRTQIQFGHHTDKSPGMVWYRDSVNCEVRRKWVAHPEVLNADDVSDFQRHSKCLFLRKVKTDAVCN